VTIVNTIAQEVCDSKQVADFIFWCSKESVEYDSRRVDMKPGDKVQVKSYPDRILVRILVNINKTKAFICTEEEWKSANAERREPDCIGFPVSDVTA
jgi:hypothetical protein